MAKKEKSKINLYSISNHDIDTNNLIQLGYI